MMQSNKTRLPARTSIYTALAASSLLSFAVQANNLVLEEVVVTAQKRAENLQDVAAAIAAVSSEMLDDNGITEFTDTTKLVPGLVMKKSSATGTNISLRGINFDSHSGSSEAVDVYWNDAPYSSMAMFTSMFDVERLEVLRGPQGTLQGKTSPAGAILMHTKRPYLDAVEGQIKSSVADNGKVISEFGINLPLSDSLAMRLAGIYNDHKGNNTVNRLTGEGDEGTVEGARLSFLYQPNNNFDALLTGQYVDNTAIESKPVIGDYNGYSAPGFADSDFGPISLGDKVGVVARRHEIDLETEISTLQLNWHGIEGHELTSISSYNSTNLSEKNDRDPSNILVGASERTDIENDVWSFSQEVRLASTTDHWWEYTVGAFYNKTGTHVVVTNDIAPSSLGLPFMYLDTDIEKETFGYFTHNRIDLSEDSELQIGLRYNRQRRDTKAFMDIPAYNYRLDQGSEPNYVDDSFTGGIKYIRYLTEDVMAYASLDASHRPAARTVNPRIVYHAFALESGEEDTLAFEAGIKSTLMGGRMQLNGALYYQEMNEYQAFFKEIEIADNITAPTTSNNSDLVANADAISIGAELELAFLANENWRLGALISYNDFKFADGAEGYCNQGAELNAITNWANTCDLSGSRVGDTPNWNATLNSDYTFAAEQVDYFVRALYSFTGAAYQPSLDNDINKAAAHGVVDLFAGVRSKDADWEVSLWAKNLLDKIAETQQRKTELNGYREVVTIDERAFGASVRYSFNL